WIHLLLPVLLVALRALGDPPARSLTALAQRLGVAEAAAATLVAPLEEAAAPEVAVPAAASASPLLCEFARKKENPSLQRDIPRLRTYSRRARPWHYTRCRIPTGIDCSGLSVLDGFPGLRTLYLQSSAARLNHLLFEVIAVAMPPVAYSFVTKSCPALHTF